MHVSILESESYMVDCHGASILLGGDGKAQACSNDPGPRASPSPHHTHLEGEDGSVDSILQFKVFIVPCSREQRRHEWKQEGGNRKGNGKIFTTLVSAVD